MCGIAGLIYSDPTRSVDRSILKAMGERIVHRGPDAEGFLFEPGIGLVHRRLSIIDLAGGDQPIGNEDGTVQVIFNGEIYNFQELRKELEAKGHRFRTHSDTEVLVHSYEEYGEDFVARLRGMFAFAIWDRPQRRLFLARDRVGIKPLYFFRDNEKLIFGSELKAILAYPGLRCDVDNESLEEYLAFGMVPGARSIFRHIQKLPPAHVLVVQSDQWRRPPQRYWQLCYEPDHRLSTAEWAEAIKAKLDEAVRLHLIADVPVGVFLSGGLDSSVVVATRAGLTSEPLQSFSMGFAEENFSELPYARQVAGQFHTQHVEEIVTPDAVSILDQLTHYYDEPFADSSAIPTFLVSRLASRSVKVVLSGDGGDEAFGGYGRYAHDLREASIRSWLPAWFRRGGIAPLARMWPKADWLPRPFRAKTTLTNLSLDAASAYANTLASCRRRMRKQLLAPDVLHELNGYDAEKTVREGHAASLAPDALGCMLAADVAVLLPDDFLVKVDRASMAWGLEVRPPMLDHELLEMAARIPSKLKIHRGETKWILKKTYERLLPHDVVWRRKQGFEIPVDAWLREPLRDMFESAVLQPQGPICGLINLEMVRKVYGAHLAGSGRHGSVLWSLLVLARWAERYLRAGSAPPTTSARSFAATSA